MAPPQRQLATTSGIAMTPAHPAWDDFCERLEGVEGCNFHYDDDEGKTRWTCSAKQSYEHAFAILRAHWPDVDLGASATYWQEHGGYCDCEILFNVAE